MAELEALRNKAEADALRRAEAEQQLKAGLEVLRRTEIAQRQNLEEARASLRIAEEEARLRSEEEARLAAQLQAQQQVDAEARRQAIEEARQQTEAEAHRLAQEDAELLAELEAVRTKAEIEAQQRAIAEEELKSSIEQLNQVAATQLERIERLRAELRETEAEARRQAEEEARLRAVSESLHQEEADERIRTAEEACERALAKAADDEARVAELEAIRRQTEADTKELAERELELSAEIRALRKAEVIQAKRVEKLEAQLLNEPKSRQPGEQKGRGRSSKSKSGRRSAEEEKRAALLEEFRNLLEQDVQELTSKEKQLSAKVKELCAAELDQLKRIEKSKAILRSEREIRRGALEEARDEAQQISQHPVTEQRVAPAVEVEAVEELKQQDSSSINFEFAFRRVPEQETVSTIEPESQYRSAEQESESPSEIEDEVASVIDKLRDGSWHVELTEQERQPIEWTRAEDLEPSTASWDVRQSETADAVDSQVDELYEVEKLAADELTEVEPSFEPPTITAAPEFLTQPEEPEFKVSTDNHTADAGWFAVTPERPVDEPMQKGVVPHEEDVVPVVLTPAPVPSLPTQPAGDIFVKSIDMLKAEKGMEAISDEDSAVSVIAQRLNSSDPNERVAALADLMQLDEEESFTLITKSFDDQSVEVRNAAARALYGLKPDRAASFTRALRESAPEQRRRIGAALVGSGIAGDAINSLAGESREKTYDAFSILFLMAKTGEVQTLIQTIEKHPNMDVRLAVIKLLAFSNQPEIVSAFRSLAVRGSLPTEVRSAVMEAIYQISSQDKQAPSMA